MFVHDVDKGQILNVFFLCEGYFTSTLLSMCLSMTFGRRREGQPIGQPLQAYGLAWGAVEGTT